MDFSFSSSSSSSLCPQKKVHDHQRTHFPIPIERRPRMLLKDFLNENSNSCSSSGFKSFPRQSPFDSNSKPTKSNSKPRKSNSNSNMGNKLLRSRSKATSTSISAFHSLMNAVKNTPFTAVKTPSVLPRILSRRLSRSSSRSNSSKQESQNQVQITVRIKDIIRWTSFRDEKLPPPPPLDYASSPLHCTTSTTITASTTTCTTCSSNSSSNGSSWCDSDFTSEFLPSWGGIGNNSEEGGEKYLPCVGKECIEATTGTRCCTGLGPQPQLEVGVFEGDEDDEQRSPVSVLDFQFGEDEEETFSTSFDQSLANLQSTKEMLMQKTKLFESLATVDFEEEQEDGIEEKAMGLLSNVKETSSTLNLEDKLWLDFFREELSAQRNQNDDGFNCETMGKAKAWVSGEHHAFEWGMEYTKEACVRDMHKGGRWNKFECEKEELALEIETAMLGFLVDEFLDDL